jgi:peroxiredoxin
MIPTTIPKPDPEDLMKYARILFALAVVVAFAAPAMAHCGKCGTGEAHAEHAHHMAPDFELTDHMGKTHKLSDYQGKVVVLEWTNPQCPFVVRHYKADTMTNLAAKYGEDIVWLAVDSSNFVTAESATKWAKAEGIEYPILLDASGEIGRMYEAKTTPHMFVIGTEGEVLYNGAIDDDASGKSENPNNYVEAAVASALAGQPVETAQTKPYGCSVKYSKKSAKSASAS